MQTDYYSIHPYSRIAFIVFCTASIIACNNMFLMSCYLLIGIFPYFFVLRKVGLYVKLIVFGFIPIYVSAIVIYVFAFKYGISGFDIINYKILKLIIITSAIQLFLSFHPNEQIDSFIKWKFKGGALITILSALSIWNDIVKRTDKIITARYARGFIAKRNLFNSMKQIPFSLLPLITGTMRTAVERSESWNRKDIDLLLSNWDPKPLKTHTLSDLYLISITVVFFLSSLILR